MIKAIYFDLFFTLIIPAYDKANSEFDILGLSMSEWEKYAEDAALYHERALGLVKSETEIIDKIIAHIPFDVNDIQKEMVLAAREKRIFQSTLPRGERLSNADMIDCKY